MSQEPTMYLYGNNEHDRRQNIKDTLNKNIQELAKTPYFERLHPRDPNGRFGKKSSPDKKTGSPIPSTEPPGKLKPGGLIPEFMPGERSIKIIKKNGETTYEMTLTNGQKVQLVDKTGKAGPFARDWLNAVARMQELYGLKPPRKLVVEKNIPKDLIGTYSWVVQDLSPVKDFLSKAIGRKSLLDTTSMNNVIHVNLNVMGGKNLTKNVRGSAPGSYMDQAYTANTVDYILSHEFGHTYEFSKGRDSSAKALFKDSRVSKYMSKYGDSNYHEAYAEAFAEWHISRGTTNNPVAKAYAKHEQWVGYQGIQALGNYQSIQASGVVANQALGIVNQSTASNQVIIGDIFDGKSSAILLGPEGPEPTEEEINTAKQVIDEFIPE